MLHCTNIDIKAQCVLLRFTVTEQNKVLHGSEVEKGYMAFSFCLLVFTQTKTWKIMAHIYIHPSNTHK